MLFSTSLRLVRRTISRQFPAISRCTRRTFSSYSASSSVSISVNSKSYRVPSPSTSTAVITLDGAAPAYFSEAFSSNSMPFLQSQLSSNPERAQYALCAACMPTYTNPNNMAIVCGTTPDVTGIVGNYYYDPETKQEVMMNEPDRLQCPTIFPSLVEHGVNVRILTAKHKLLRLLSNGLPPSSDSVLAASMERATESPVNLGLTSAPDIYDPQISIALLETANRLMSSSSSSSTSTPSVYYLSTTDYVQHKYPPHAAEALEFMSSVDQQLAEMHAAGTRIVLTADHGMSDKHKYDGTPAVTYLQDSLEAAGFGPPRTRVILPITDPYVKHHSSLGGYATVYFEADQSYTEDDITQCMSVLRDLPGVYTVMNRLEASKAFNLPNDDRIGHIVVVSDELTALGKTLAYHVGQDSVSDVSAAQATLNENAFNLRTHGGLSEMTVPMVVIGKEGDQIRPDVKRQMHNGSGRNFHAFDIALNGWEE
jgi:phosphonoacetate hydrolase